MVPPRSGRCAAWRFRVDVVTEIPFTDKFFDFILEHNALFGGVADIFVISVILVLVSFEAVPS